MKYVTKTKPRRRSDCPVACTLDLVGDRWTMLIVRDLVQGKRYFAEFQSSPEKIATNILSARLQVLCAQGLVEKIPDPTDQRRFAYELSEDGVRLRELLGDMARWGLKYFRGTKPLDGIRLPQR